MWKPFITVFLFEGFSSFGWVEQAYLLYCFPDIEPSDSVRERDHCDYYLPGWSSPYIHVLFFWASSPSLRLSILCHHPSYIFWPPLYLPVHRYPRLCNPVLLLSLSLGINNCFLLTAMGYNSYVATCNPVRYSLSSLL